MTRIRSVAVLFLTLLLAGSGYRTFAGYTLMGSRAQAAAARHTTKTCRDVFQLVQRGLTSGDVSLFSPYFAPQVMINLHGGENGSYSSGQAHYVLENYCRPRRFGHFTFTTIEDSGSNPYATGSVAFNYRGRRDLAQVYVSLTQSGDRWVISQINIY